VSDYSTLPPGEHPPRSLGYLQDRPDARDVPASRLFGGTPTRSDVIIPASMIRHVVGALDQQDAGSCVSFALTRAVNMWHRADAERNSLPADEIPLGAPGYVYFNARQQEVIEAGIRGEATVVRDAGSYPRLAMRAIQRLGFCPSAAYPYEDALREIRAARAEARGERPPPPTAFRAAHDQAGLRYYRISAFGRDRVAEVARAIAMNCPVVFGMVVDSAFMRNRGERITSVAEDDPSAGGHMMCAFGATIDDVLVVNSWGAGWGQGGLCRISHDLFGSAIVSDVYALQAAPLFATSHPGEAA
jgi:hypothetical protein